MTTTMFAFRLHLCIVDMCVYVMIFAAAHTIQRFVIGRWGFWKQVPLRPNTTCWVLHPGFNNEVVGVAKARVYNKSRSVHKHLVSACRDGEQYILFKKFIGTIHCCYFPTMHILALPKCAMQLCGIWEDRRSG